MKQFIKKTDKVSAFQFDEIFPSYKEIQKLLGGGDICISFINHNASILIQSTQVDASQVLLICDGKMETMDKKLFDSTYEQVNKEVVRETLIYRDNPFQNPLIPNTPNIPHYPYSPYFYGDTQPQNVITTDFKPN